MFSGIPTPEQSTGALSPPATAPKPHRILACVQCQQRKVKCDRKFPCANCIKAGSQCVSAAFTPRQRRRRFAERELLDRIRHYEDLLRKSNIPFEPLHASGPNSKSSNGAAKSISVEDDSTPEYAALLVGSEQVDGRSLPEYHAKNFWHAMNRKSQLADNDDNDDSEDSNNAASDNGRPPYLLRQMEVKKAWDQLYDDNEHLLFCSRDNNLDLRTLHPDQARIFKLWQIYLNNVDPLLKVTHTPTLQTRIIDAASDVTNISPPLEALMFGIYCVAVFTLNQEECYNLFGAQRQDILSSYQLGAREALLKCGFMKSSDRECLTALHLYLISIKTEIDPRSLSSMLGAAFRIAQRMGIHSEAANVRYHALEAELRRRLWWSLVLFDARISEMTEFKTGMLLPTWNCKVPLNINDFDLRSEMQTPPAVYGHSSEALFAVVRSEIADFTRNSSFHLDFINPALKSMVRRSSGENMSETDELNAVDKVIEGKYISSCNPDNPLHFMTIWTARGHVAKNRFVQHLSACSRSIETLTETQREAGISYALRMLECDTKLMASTLIKGFRWLIFLHFPFPAYVHLVQELRQQPLRHDAEKCWEVMSKNCAARFMDIENKENPMDRKTNPFFKIFTGVILKAWEIRGTTIAKLGRTEVPPPIITQIRKRLEQLEIQEPSSSTEQHDSSMGTVNNSLLTPVPMVFDSFDPLYNTCGDGFGTSNSGPPPMTPTQASMSFDGTQWGWPTQNWNSMLGYGW